jgi:KUP system potassium uptake protein
MRADNQGQGGILALMALALQKPGSKRRHAVLLMLGVAGAALFYGDGIITPAISVLSAIEGLKIATPLFEPYIVPITAVIVAVSSATPRPRRRRPLRSGDGDLVRDHRGAGLRWIGSEPRVFGAVNPTHAWRFFAERLPRVFVLGSVFLVVTGGERCIDMGHFGKRPSASRGSRWSAVFVLTLGQGR